MIIRDDIILEDTTLRDGEQAPGIAWSKETKLKVLAELISAGVKWIEVGIPKMGGEELDFVREARDHAGDARLVAWNRGVMEDVKQSLDLGYDAVHIGLPTSDIHLSTSVNKSRDWVAQRARDLISYAKDRGAFVSISAEDVGRTDPGFLRDYAGIVGDAGADRLRLSDTIGILTPEAYAEKVGIAVNATRAAVQTHCHNDFGLAVANTLAGLRAGARFFHVCVNGMGERAGMPDLAQTVMALKLLYDRDVGVQTELLTKLSSLVADATSAPVEPWKPVVGYNVFAHESGIHSNGVLRDSRSFEPIPPEAVGGQRRIVIGKHSGRAAIVHALEGVGQEFDEDLMLPLLARVREESIRIGGELTVPALVRLYADMVSPARAA
jgi:isopropylmalate/homocitrate/citramalate synthase